MQGPPAVGQTGNGARQWPALAEQARQHTQDLQGLINSIAQERTPHQVTLDRLAKLGSVLARVTELVSKVKEHASADESGTQLVGLLGAFSRSLQAANDATGDLEWAISSDLHAQARETDGSIRRSLEEALKDRQTLRRVRRTAVDCLEDLRGHLDGLLQYIEGLIGH